MSAILAVPGSIAAMDWKNSVVVATTGNVALSGNIVVDGVTLTTGMRVLVKNQTNPAQNGVYTSSSGSWTRATDFNGTNIHSMNAVGVEQGTVNANKIFLLTTVGTITIGTTAINFKDITPDASATTRGMVVLGLQSEINAGNASKVVTGDTLANFTGLGEKNTLSSQGGGVSLVGSKVGNALGVATLVAGENIEIERTANDVTIRSTAGGGIANIGDVIDAILTDGDGILLDSDGNVLYELTIV
ncbi:MAG: hypothetical protein ACK5LG_21915 [Bacteroides thetaiotaomicron]